jgi:hypothetical protein
MEKRMHLQQVSLWAEACVRASVPAAGATSTVTSDVQISSQVELWKSSSASARRLHIEMQVANI